MKFTDSINIKNIQQPIDSELLKLQEFFAVALKTDNPLLEDINDFIVSECTQKVHPILTILSAGLCGSISENTYYAAISMELLQTAREIHSDVTNQTNSITKSNGSANKVSVLSGDYLLAGSLISGAKTNEITILKAISEVGMQLSDGELLEIKLQDYNKISLEEYLIMANKKTAMLFAASALVGGLSTQANEEQLNHLSRFGEFAGMYYHILHDVDFFDSKSVSSSVSQIELMEIYKAKAQNELTFFEATKYQKALSHFLQFSKIVYTNVSTATT
ncbi:MAG: hypothetical protein AUK44_08355 [Porphyromonadaceae bacterium CG2_30_38_12]|nr:MAG: hypothetical protein AUK44_08355 [Porphyromonadaceae bacterium CG2_30_38_12]